MKKYINRRAAELDADLTAMANTQKWRTNLRRVFLAKLIDPTKEIAERKEYLENEKINVQYRKAIGIGIIRRFNKIMNNESTDFHIEGLRKKKFEQ